MDGHVTPFLAFGTPSIFWNGCRLLQFIESAYGKYDQADEE